MRIAEINAARVRNCGYLVFATDPSKGVDSAEVSKKICMLGLATPRWEWRYICL
jgi:hypothetical protein